MKEQMNKFSDLTNEELWGKLRENLDENDLMFQEIIKRQDDGIMKKPKRIEGSLIDYFKNEMSQRKVS